MFDALPFASSDCIKLLMRILLYAHYAFNNLACKFRVEGMVYLLLGLDMGKLMLRILWENQGEFPAGSVAVFMYGHPLRN